MKNDKNLNPIGQFKAQLNTPKTYEQFVLEQSLTDQQDLYPDLVHEDISSSRGYGPGRGPGNGNNKKKNHKDDGISSQHLINTFNNKLGCDELNLLNADGSAHKEDDGWHAFNLTSSAGARVGAGGLIADADCRGSLMRYDDGVGDLRVLSGTLGGEIGGGSGGVTARYSANVDAVNIQAKGWEGNIGLDGGSGFTAGPGGVEVKAAGFGVSVGKKMGISTPFGGISVDTEEACKQQ